MIDPTHSQLGLLYLCSICPGPSIKELYQFGPSYGASRESLRADYIILLNELLVWPISSIDLTTYLPSICLITEKGKEYLQRVFDDEPDWFHPEPFLNADELLAVIQGKLQSKDVIRDFQTFDESTADEIATLAETYLYWAQSPPTNELRLPQDKLFYAAAIGFAKLNDLRHFSRSIKGYFIALEEEGNYLDLAVRAARAIEDFPNCADITSSTAFAVLEKPYWDLTGKAIPKLTKHESFRNFLNEIADIAIQTGKGYKFKLPDHNPLFRIANRIEDILRVAFRTSNRSLYLQVIDLESIVVDIAKSMVEITEKTGSFESRAGYQSRVELAKRSCGVLGSYAELVNLEEPLRETAYGKALEILRIIRRGAVMPVWRMCVWDSDENRAGPWTFYLLRFTENKMRVNLIRLFTQLDKLRAKLDIEKTDQEAPVKSLVDPAAIKDDLDYIKSKVTKLDEIKSDTNVMRYVWLPSVEGDLAELIEMSQINQTVLGEVCHNVLCSDTLLHNIDSELNEMLPEIRRDVESLIVSIEKSTSLSINERETFLKEFGEIVKMSSAGKILASVPLIPGFLQYQYELGVSVNWNKWMGKLHSLFKKGSRNTYL